MTAKQKQIALLALLATIIIWGLAPVYIRSFTLAAGPADALVIRYVAVSALCVLAIPFIGGFRIETADLPRLLTISLVGMLGYNLGSVYGFGKVTAGIGSLVIATQPVLILCLAVLAGTERLHPAAMLGIAISFAGTVFLFWSDAAPGISRLDLIEGGAMIFLSGLAWAVYVVWSRSLVQKYGAFKIGALSFLIATVPMLLFASATTIPAALSLDAKSGFALFYLVVPSTFLTVGTWNYATGQLRPATVGASLYLIPPVAIGAGALMLEEAVTFRIVLAAVIVVSGVAVAQFGPLIHRTQLEGVAE